MKKFIISNKEFISLDDMKFAIRQLRNDPNIFHKYSDAEQAAVVEACNLLVRQIFLEEIKAAKTQDEIDAIIEMPGDFVVCKRVAKRSVIFFKEWYDGKPIVTAIGNEALVFSYESKAKEIAADLGEGWSICDISKAASDHRKRILDILLKEIPEDIEKFDAE